MNLVVVVSAIVTSQEPLAYTSTRSAFTPSERFTQTLKTIERLYLKVPNAYIVLAEGTVLTDDMLTCLREKVDYLHPAYLEDFVKNNVQGPHKGLGEASTLYSYLTSEHFKSIQSNCYSVSKISGRYYPTDEFQWDCPSNGMKCVYQIRNRHHSSGLWMSTMFYTIHFELFSLFIEALQTCLNDPQLSQGIALEHVLLQSLKNHKMPLYQIDKFHVGGEYGPWGGYVEH